MGLRNTDIIPQRSSSVLTSGSIPSHRNIHVLIALLVLNCSGQPFWDPQLLSVILGKHKQTLSPKPIESAPLSPDSAPHYLSGVLCHIFKTPCSSANLKSPWCLVQLVPKPGTLTCPKTGNLIVSIRELKLSNLPENLDS